MVNSDLTNNLRHEELSLCNRFRHFLDSGEQALTVIVLFNDIKPRCGGTYIAPDGIKHVIKWYSSVVYSVSPNLTLLAELRLYNHPEGSDGWDIDETGSRVVCNIQQCNNFVELTGNAGDIILCHPFMVCRLPSFAPIHSKLTLFLATLCVQELQSRPSIHH